MRRATIAVISISFILAAGCKQQSTTETSASAPSKGVSGAQSNLSAEDLGELGAKIKKNPKLADQLLSERGLTRESFEKAVRKVAESPEDSRRYAAAYKKASS